MNTNLNDLLETKSFTALTEQERDFVLSLMPEDDYIRQRKLVLSARSILKEKTLVPALPSKAIIALQAKKPVKKGRLAFLNSKIPTWAAVAACLIIFLLVEGQNMLEEPQKETVYITTVDTFYVEKMVRNITENKFTRKDDSLLAITSSTPHIQPKQYKPEPNHEPAQYTREMLGVEQINYTLFFSSFSQSNGVSMQQDTLTQWVNNQLY